MRGYESHQFGSFDGLDNRKAVYAMIKRIGHDLPEMQAAQKRADFLKGLLALSTNGFKFLPMGVNPCSVTEAYFLFVAITGSLSVPVEAAAKHLEEAVR